MSRRRIDLHVPFTEKSQAKRLGAWWDPTIRKWYARFGERKLVSRWRPEVSTEKNLSRKISNYFKSKPNPIKTNYFMKHPFPKTRIKL